jgi:YD repeat-containing protein
MPVNLPSAAGASTTTITYDQAGRKTAMSDPDMGTWTYTYDALSNLTRQTDARGQRICLYYDALNRLTGKHYRTNDNCPASPTWDVYYGYDFGTNGLGRRTSLYTATVSKTTVWTYDARGRLKTEYASGYNTEWEYNAAVPIWMQYPDGELNYTYTNMLLNSVVPLPVPMYHPPPTIQTDG